LLAEPSSVAVAPLNTDWSAPAFEIGTVFGGGSGGSSLSFLLQALSSSRTMASGTPVFWIKLIFNRSRLTI
jgi:hypothetical protein